MLLPPACIPERSILLFVLTLSVSLIKDINSLHKPVSQREEKYPQLQRKYHFCLMIKTNQCERRHKAATRKFWWVASYKILCFSGHSENFCFLSRIEHNKARNLSRPWFIHHEKNRSFLTVGTVPFLIPEGARAAQYQFHPFSLTGGTSSLGEETNTTKLHLSLLERTEVALRRYHWIYQRNDGRALPALKYEHTSQS